MISNIIKAVVLASIAMPSIATVANAEYIYHCRNGGKFAKCGSIPQTNNISNGFHSRTRGIETSSSWFINPIYPDLMKPNSEVITGKRFEALKAFAHTCRTESSWIALLNKDYAVEGDGYTAERLSTMDYSTGKIHSEVKITLGGVSHNKNIYGETTTDTKSVSCFFSEDSGRMLSNSQISDTDPDGNTRSDVIRINN